MGLIPFHLSDTTVVILQFLGINVSDETLNIRTDQWLLVDGLINVSVPLSVFFFFKPNLDLWRPFSRPGGGPSEGQVILFLLSPRASRRVNKSSFNKGL